MTQYRIAREKLMRETMEKKLLQRMGEHRRALSAFRAQAAKNRSLPIRIADKLTTSIGSVPFLIFHLCLFTFWIVFNLRVLSVVQPFDPFPFGLLTLAMTLEQSLLTIFIIISQNRASEIADLRNEMDLQINILAEEEISKVIHMLRLIGEKLDISEIANDHEARVMESPINHVELEKQTQQEIEEVKSSPETVQAADGIGQPAINNAPNNG
jgi:uncharacterized membrane protein